MEKEKMHYQEAKAIEKRLFYRAVNKCLDKINFSVCDWLSEEEAQQYEKALSIITKKH